MRNNDNNNNNNKKRRRQESEASPSSSSSPARRRACAACNFFGNQCKEDCPFAKYLPAGETESVKFKLILQESPPEKHQLVLLALILGYKWIHHRIHPTETRDRVIESLMADITASNSTTLHVMNQVLHYNVQRQPQPQPPLPNIQSSAQQPEPAPRGSSGMNRGQATTSPGRHSGMSRGQANTNSGRRSGNFNFGPFAPPNTNPGCRNRSKANTNNPGGSSSSSGINLGQASGSSDILTPGHQAITNNPGVGGMGLPSYVVPANPVHSSGIISFGPFAPPNTNPGRSSSRNQSSQGNTNNPGGSRSSDMNRGEANTNNVGGVNLGQASGSSSGIINPGYQAITNNNPGVGSVGLPSYVVEFNNLLYRHGMLNQYYTQQLQPMPRGIHIDNQANTSSNPNVVSYVDPLPDGMNKLIQDDMLLGEAISSRVPPKSSSRRRKRSAKRSQPSQTSNSNLGIDLNVDITGQVEGAPQGPNP